MCSLKKRLKGFRNWDLCYCNEGSRGFDPDSMTAFVRFDGRKSVLVFCNFTGHEVSVLLSLPRALREAACISTEKVPVSAAPWAYTVLNCA